MEPSVDALADTLRNSGACCPLKDWPGNLQHLDEPGLYAWWIDAAGAEIATARLESEIEPGIVYAGQAGAYRRRPSSATLQSRLERNHIGGRIRNSTFRLTLAALLFDDVEPQNLGGRNIGSAGEAIVTDFMWSHLSLTVVRYGDRRALAVVEESVLSILDPPLNIQKVTMTPIRQVLKARRSILRQST